MKNPRVTRRKEIFKIRAEINAKGTKETIAKINKAKSWFFERIDKIDKPLARLLCELYSPNKNTGVGCHFLLQGIFLTQGLNLGLLHCRQIFYHLNHQGKSIASGTTVLINPSTSSLSWLISSVFLNSSFL